MRFRKPLFRTGRVLLAKSVQDAEIHRSVVLALERHQTGDWRDCRAYERKRIRRAILTGAKIRSFHRTPCNRELWIVTDQKTPITNVFFADLDR